ncbi:MAG: hypothetical protein LBR88_09790 [Zoogloeaceae bacterium]|nr:hypothetical protein [Zoogloeaceae bacterium]
MKKVSLDHISIGSRRSGSWNISGETHASVMDELEANPEYQKWFKDAREGDTFPVYPGVFVTMWE